MEIRLQKMTERDFEEYLSKSIISYAAEKKKGEGLTDEEAHRVASDSFKNLLPQGLATPKHSLNLIVQSEGNLKIGILWYAQMGIESESKRAFIYDIEIDQAYRGRGLSKTVFTLLESELKLLGINSIRLHVFEHNQIAIALYEKLGFCTTNRNMVKNF